MEQHEILVWINARRSRDSFHTPRRTAGSMINWGALEAEPPVRTSPHHRGPLTNLILVRSQRRDQLGSRRAAPLDAAAPDADWIVLGQHSFWRRLGRAGPRPHQDHREQARVDVVRHAAEACPSICWTALMFAPAATARPAAAPQLVGGQAREPGAFGWAVPGPGDT